MVLGVPQQYSCLWRRGEPFLGELGDHRMQAESSTALSVSSNVSRASAGGRALNRCGMRVVSSRVVSFADAYEYQTGVRAMDAEVLCLGGGEFRAELTQINFERLWMQRGEESLPRIARGSVTKDRVPVSFSLRKNRIGSQVNGIEVSPGMLIVHSATELHNKSSTPPAWGSVSLAPADLAALGRSIAGRELTRPPFAYAVRPAPMTMAHLIDLHENAARLAATAPETLAHPQVARSLESALIHAFVRCLTENTAFERAPVSLSRMKIISRLEEYVESNSDRPIHLGELCAELGVSESTLRRACHEHLGIGPNRYLWLRRMHLARRALLRADSSTTTVTAVATGQGFWELGRFSVEYRALFGEPPLVTLRRSPQQPPTTNRPLDLPMTEFA
jgi:AraC-like DNA-binding protein